MTATIIPLTAYCACTAATWAATSTGVIYTLGAAEALHANWLERPTWEGVRFADGVIA